MMAGKRFAPRLAIGILIFVCMAGWMANPSDSQAAYSVLHNFSGGSGDGLQPHYGAPVFSGSTLYGMTSGGGEFSAGVLYKMNPNGTGFQILETFGSSDGLNGTAPRGSLTLSGSTLYGFTAYGGGPTAWSVGGTVFKINPDGGGYQILHNFGAGTNNQCHPYGAPVVAGSTLYGTTSSENSGLFGEIFAMSTGGGAPQVLYTFTGKPDGAFPYGSLTLVGSRLYGMTSTGGSGGISGGGSGYGVIYSLNTDGSDYRVLYNFQGAPNDGNNPYGALTLVGSKLYGMTSSGGAANGPGVIFSINLDGSGYQVVFDFSSLVNIGGPLGSLTPVGSTLYGMTSGGGTGGNGVIFRINPDGTGFEVLHGFNSATGDGGYPMGDLTFSGSAFYGWTYAGGASGGGVVFSLQPLAIVADKDQVRVAPGRTAPIQVKLSEAPAADVAVTAARLSGTTALSIQGASMLTFTPTNWNNYQTFQIAATPDRNGLNATAVFQFSGPGLMEKQVTALKTGTGLNPGATLNLLLDH
jgi:uncharacterized repeat protein (TIGR03803 family)